MTTPKKKTPKKKATAKKKQPVKRTRGTKPATKPVEPEKKAPKVERPAVKKVAVICSPGLDNHLGEVGDFLKANYEVKFCVTWDMETIFNAVGWADVVWIEWANKTAVDVTSLGHLMYQKQVILRLHSYEAFGTDPDWIHWACITDLIFVAAHVRDLVLKKYPTIKDNVDRIHLIPNGIDCERFTLPDSRRYQPTPLNKKIACLGFINYKKGPQLLWTSFAELLKNDPEFELHIAGEFQDPRYEEYFKHMRATNPVFAEKVVFHGWIAEPEKWLSNFGYVVCTSMWESQHKALMEGMAMGLKPLVYNFVGASDIYPEGVIWNTASEFCSQARGGGYNAAVYRDHVVKNYNTVDIVRRLKAEVFDAAEKAVEVFRPDKDNAPPIKLCAIMIMRDEAENMDRCLASIKDVCDDIVIVDNGSKDRGPKDPSLKIAAKYGAKVYDHYCKPDDFDFSKYRNLSIGHAPKRADWLLVIDFDEELVGDKDGFKKSLAAIADDYNAVSINVKDAIADAGNEVNGSRCFRKGHVTYRRAWHNIALADGIEKLGAVLYKDVSLIHYGSVSSVDEETAKRKNLRTKKLIEKALEQDPEDFELYFYMLQAYGTEEKFQAAVNCGEKYLAARHRLPSFQLAVYTSLIRMYAIELKNIDRALQLLREAMILLPEDLDIAYVECELGVMTGNGQMVVSGARRFARLYKVFKDRPDAKAGRFIFFLKPESLLFCLKHSASYLFQDATNNLKLLQGSIAEFPPGDAQAAAEKEIAETLEPLGIETH